MYHLIAPILLLRHIARYYTLLYNTLTSERQNFQYTYPLRANKRSYKSKKYIFFSGLRTIYPFFECLKVNYQRSLKSFIIAGLIESYFLDGH